MLDLSIAFVSYLNIFWFLLFWGIFSLWANRKLREKPELSLGPFIFLSLLFLLIWAGTEAIDGDETENLHCSWMVAQGLIPYLGFWQHHSPLLWLILSPLLKVLKPSVLVFDLSRIFTALIFCLNAFIGWQIAKKVLPKVANLKLYLLVLLCAAIDNEFMMLRPDLFLTLFLLTGLYCSLEIADGKLFPLFLTGVSFGIAESFSVKNYLVVLLPLMIIIWQRQRRIIPKLLIYFAGLATGVFPLVAYLLSKGILNEFIFWVFKFNSYRIEVIGIFPVAVGFMGVWGIKLLYKKYRYSHDTSALVLCIAFVLSTLSMLTRIERVFVGYYLGFWFVLCAILVSGCSLKKLVENVAALSKKALLIGLLLSLLITPNFINALEVIRAERNYKKDKDLISELMQYCVNDTCVVLLRLHPVFSHDATRLYSYWQYFHFIDISASVKSDAKSKDMARQIINLRPAVVVYKFKKDGYFINEGYFLLDLFQKNLISADEYRELSNFLNKNYTVISIGKDKFYYIRKDKIQKENSGKVSLHH